MLFTRYPEAPASSSLDAPDELERAIEHCTIELETDNVLRALRIAERADGVRHAVLFGRRLHLVVDDAARALDVLPGIFSAAGIAVRRMSPVSPSLEDAVMALLRAVPASVRETEAAA